MNYLTVLAAVKKWGVPSLSLVAMFVAVAYLNSHFHCILETDRKGFEWECANESTLDTLKGYIQSIEEFVQE